MADPGLRIGFVLTATHGGIGRHVAGMIPRLQARGHQVRVWCPDDVAGGPLAGVDVCVRPLTRLLRIGSADVVHAHGYKAAAVAGPIARLTRTPMICTWHNDIPPAGVSRLIGAGLRRVAAATSTVVLGVSSDLVAAATALGAAAVLAPVPAPPPPTVDRDRDRTRSMLGFGPDDFMIISVARLAPQKNLDLLLDIAGRTPRAHYLICGDGPDRDRLQSRIDREQLPVRLLGHRRDVPELLAAADLSINTSRWEGSSLALQECLQLGVPLIATDVGGTADIVGDGAILFDPEAADVAAVQVTALIDDPQRRRRLATQGRRQAASWPTEEQTADRLADLYARHGGPIS